ncbi:class I SAM-dependent methyltransferase [Paenibacillus tepidiphilus]|uniref:class I SAM-dependent methyltransferase n=1 Tax=Paenibacillus tepidiphilus TaxID=2608683 RepID=UPI00123962C5|nr:class I SAM-dependent methyltransferase [Paenibacillus tepidiphilus]
MDYTGSEFYDNDANFAKYMERRQWQENANDTLEKPVILELIGDVQGKKILDLGCGDAKFAKDLFDLGCEEYSGIEGSANMVQAAAAAVKGYNASVIHTTMESWQPLHNSFDLVISRLAVHYIEDLASLLQKIHQALKPGGSFIFSLEHPVITSTLQTSGTRTNWIVDNYFIEGYREQQWLGGSVQKYHRSIEQYYIALQQAGFRIDYLRESNPQRKNFSTDETYERRLRIPLFLFLSASK